MFLELAIWLVSNRMLGSSGIMGETIGGELLLVGEVAAGGEVAASL